MSEHDELRLRLLMFELVPVIRYTSLPLSWLIVQFSSNTGGEFTGAENRVQRVRGIGRAHVVGLAGS